MRKIAVLLLAMCIFSGTSTYAQKTKVTGKVTDASTGKPVFGATVQGKGDGASTVTDADGTFSIDLPAKVSTLLFSSVGYKSAEIKITGSNLMVTLAQGVDQLQEVIVTGFGTKIKRDVTGSFSRVKAKEIENMPVASVDAAIQGRAAGVMVNSQSGKLGQAVTVRIRGNSSISANSQPLYVVDGVPVTTESQSSYGGAMNPLTDINPNDIESIDVLKDASAGAIFGARAANGVILITTKRGKVGKTSINFSYQTGTSKETRRVKFLNAEQYSELFQRATTWYDNRFGVDPNDPASETSFAKDWMAYHSFDQWLTDPTKSYDWQDQAFQKGRFNQADLSLSGGNEKTRFFGSLQIQDQTGIMVGNDLNRISSRINVDHTANKWLTVGFTTALARTMNRRLPDDNAFSNPLQSIAFMPVTPFTDPNTGLPTGTPPGDLNVGLYYNPRLTVDYARFKQEVFRNLSNVFATAKITGGLSYHTEFGADILSQNEEGFFQSQTRRNQTRAFQPTGVGIGINRSAFVINYNTNNYFNYNETFGEHNIDATLGMSYQSSQSKYNFTEGVDFPSDSYQKIASAATKSNGSSSETNFRFLSYFTRVNYKFKDKYLATLSVRRDASSRFGKNSRYGYFPSGSLGWVLSEENFFSPVKAVSFLKVRASYGRVGNAEIGNFPQLGLFSGDAGYAGNAGQRPTQIANPNLRWETTDQFDVGLDFGLFGNRITGELDYYVKKTSGLLLNVNVPATTGFTTQTKNVGKLENKGFELVLNTQNLIGKFNWNTTINLANNRGKVVDIQGQIIEGGISSMNRVMEGQPVGVFYTVEWAGVNPENGDAQFYTNTVGQDGQLVKDKVNGAGYNAAQRVVVGDPNPDYIFGVTNSFSYKGIDLSVFINGVWGNQLNIYGMGRYSSANFRFEDNQTADQINAWTTPGQITDIPQARWLSNNGAQLSSRYIVNGSYARIRTVTLGYTLPAKMLSRLKLERVRIYASALNLHTFTNYPYWDPEVNADSFDSNIAKGNDFYTPPQPRTILFGINIGL
ncbi:MAG TPA: TonB-dependent receptor [Ferruginibacter sp.]|nr:TonB-dependent receptor [Ferruginibacter sp.]HMP20730.1 TonB-dependent receptor [Ferruginibacter sp.]